MTESIRTGSNPMVGSEHLTPEQVGGEQFCRALRQGRWAGVPSKVLAELESDFFGFTEDEASYDLRRFDLKIRQLINKDASWNEVRSYAWQRFRLESTDKAAADLVETVFVCGNTHEVADVLVGLNEEGYDYYFRLAPKLRDLLIIRLWKIDKTKTLAEFLDHNDAKHPLSRCELLFEYHRARTNKDESQQFMIFKDHEAALVEAIKQYGSRVGYSLAGAFFDVGTLAVNLGFVDYGKKLLERVSPDTPYYSQALQVLMVVAHDADSPASRSYFKKLEQAGTWRERAQMMEQYVSDCRQRADKSDIRRPVVNEVLSNPFKWVPNLPVAYGAVSAVVAKNTDLLNILPGMFESYKDHALKFHAPALDAAIWEPLVYEMKADTPPQMFWRGVALLHQYVNFGKAQEDVLWNAKECVLEATRTSPFPLPYDWRDLQNCLSHAVAKSPHLGETRRLEMMSQVKIAASPGEISLGEIEEYLVKSTFKPTPVLRQLEKIASAKGSKLLRTKILRQRASQTHYTNEDLNSLWGLACQLSDGDLAWRVATVLHGRGSLSERVNKPWMISGERRSEYPFFVPQLEHFQLCMEGMSEKLQKLCWACLKIGPMIPELLAALDDSAKSVKGPTPPSGSFEASIEKILNQASWIPRQKQHFRFGFEGVVAGVVQLPDFIQVLPNNIWSYLYIRLADRFGVNAWGWKLSQLHQQVEDLLPKIASHQSINKLSYKVARWLKALTPEQRSAWQDLVSLHKHLSDEEGMRGLANFIGRLTLVFHPSHVQALKSLRTMRAPVSMTWDLEKWMLSDTYSRLRLAFDTHSRIPVPVHLQKLQTIVASAPE